MARIDTLPEYLRPLMDGVTVRTPYCAVCGRTYPLNQHHVVPVEDLEESERGADGYGSTGVR